MKNFLCSSYGGTGVAATSLRNLRETINAGTYLGSGTADLNTFQNFGVYGFGSGVTMSNCPNGINGVLMVFQSGGFTQQFWRRRGTLNENEKELWYRQISTAYDTDNLIGTWRYFLHNEMLGSDIVTINGSDEVINGSKIFKNVYAFERGATGRSYAINLRLTKGNEDLYLDRFVGHGPVIGFGGYYKDENNVEQDCSTLAISNFRHAAHKTSVLSMIARYVEGTSVVEKSFCDAGFLGTTYSELNDYFNENPTGLRTSILLSEKACVPYTDGDVPLGIPTLRWSQLYAATGTINTSDETVKTEINDIPDAVIKAWGKVNFQQFKFKDAVAKKGSNARIHIGVIAQRIISAFESEGLNAFQYGLVGFDEWSDMYEEKDIEVQPEIIKSVKVIDKPERVVDGDIIPEEFHMEDKIVQKRIIRTEKTLKRAAGRLYSVRYEECLALECAYQRWRLDQLEARLG